MTLRGLSLLALLTLMGCSKGPVGPEALRGGVVATFLVVDEEFKVWVTNDTTIRQILDLSAGRSLATIPIGRLVAGAGAADHNDPFGWHLDPERTEMAELAIEVCDAKPSAVEDDLDTWLTNVGRYCPWSAELIAVNDYR